MSRAAADAQRWAAQRRAATAKAEALRAEREAKRRVSAEPFDPTDRHLPNCSCQQCAGVGAVRDVASEGVSLNVPPPLPLPPSRLGANIAAAASGGSRRRSGSAAAPEWNTDFVDGCKDGFEALALERRKADQLRSRVEQKQRRQAQHRSASWDAAASGNGGPSVASSGSRARLRVVAAPSAKADEGPSTRINFDKRTSRHMHAADFVAAVAKFRAQALPRAHTPRDQRVRCFARKRPMFAQEHARGDFDVVTIARCWAIVHVCGMAPDLQRMHITHNHFPCTEAFGETSTNDDLHAAAMAPLVEHAISGGTATCLMYGATGSGKTYSMAAMQERVATSVGGVVSLMMLELAGKDVRDLLAPRGVQTVALRENADGDFELAGASTHQCNSSENLLQLLAQGQQRRTTCGTLANATSSRSHMVSFLSFSEHAGGALVLVDCAGSERREDSAMHTSERQREGADINSSLLALKECVRALISGASHVPYRQNNLTRLLRNSFTRPDAQLHIVATVAPGSSDAEHSVSTMRMACGLAQCSDAVMELKEDVKPVRRGGSSPPSNVSVTPRQCFDTKTDESSFDKIKNCDVTPMSRDPPRSIGGDGCNAPSVRLDRPDRRGTSQPRQQLDSTPIAQTATPARNSRGSSATRNPSTPDKAADSSSTLLHPSKWTIMELQSWMLRNKISVTLPPSVDSKAVTRWSLKRWTEACGGDERAGLRGFNGLRLEMDRLADEEKRRRKQVMIGR